MMLQVGLYQMGLALSEEKHNPTNFNKSLKKSLSIFLLILNTVTWDYIQLFLLRVSPVWLKQFKFILQSVQSIEKCYYVSFA